MTYTTLKVGAIAAILAVGSVGTEMIIRHRAAALVLKDQVVEAKDATAGAQHEAAAAADKTAITTDDAKAVPVAANVATLQAKVKAVRQEEAKETPAAPGAPIDQSALVASLTDLTTAQAAQHQLDIQRIADRDRALADQTAATESWKAAAQDGQREVAQLRILNAIKDRPWGIGGIYGSNGTAGVCIDRTIGPISVGVDIVRRTVSGGQTTVEAMAHAGVRF